MYRRLAQILLLYFYFICIKTQILVDLPDAEKNNFKRKSAFLHDVSNKILKFLDPGQEYVKLNKSKALVTMFKYQNRIAENLLSSFDEIQNMTTSYAARNSLNLRNILEDIIREEIHHSKNYYVEKSSQNKFDKEFADFVNIFFYKALNLSMKNVVKITNRVNRNPILNTPRKRTRDIKVWKPSSMEHFDLFNNTRRIYKGKKAKIKDFPFLVSILIDDVFTSAGSIISKDLVITAATGLNVLYKSAKYHELLGSVLVRVGSDYAAKEGSLVPVVDVIFHPYYDPQNLQNNLAIVRLVKRLRFSEKRKIQRIHYDKKGVFKKNSLVIVLGWGAKEADEEVDFKQKVSVARLYLFDMDKCVSIYSGFYVKDSNFCAGFSGKGGGACNKDTGGPGIVGGELAGVISFGPSVCGQAASPTVFTKVADNVEWISSVINRERSLKIETTTEAEIMPEPETITEPQTFVSITSTIPATLQQTPLKMTLQAQEEMISEVSTQANTQPTLPTAPLLRVLSDAKPRVKSHRFITVTPDDQSKINLRFSKTYSRPSLFSKSTSQVSEAYPDQALILKEILQEIILSNTSVIDYILYGDILEDNVEAKYLLSTTNAVDVMQHPLVNNSIFVIEKPEEILHPVRSRNKTKISKPIVDTHDSSSYDEGDNASQVESLNSLFPQPEISGKNIYDVDNKQFGGKSVSTYITDHINTSSTKKSKKNVTNRHKNTILFGDKDDNEEPVDLHSNSKVENKDAIDDYYDDETNVKTTKQLNFHEIKTETILTRTSTGITKYKKYENVVFNLDNIDPGNQQDHINRIGVQKYDKYNDDIKQQFNKNNINDNQQEEINQIGRDLFGNDYNKKQDSIKNNLKEKRIFTSNEKIPIRVDKYNYENVDDKRQLNHKNYLRERPDKQGEIDRIRKHVSSDDDDYSQNYQYNNNLREKFEYSPNKKGRKEKFIHSVYNYDYDDKPQRTADKKYNVGKAAPISNDAFDYNDRSIGHNEHTYNNENTRHRHNYDYTDYNKRPTKDADENIVRHDKTYKRKSNNRQDLKKSNSYDEFLSIL